MSTFGIVMLVIAIILIVVIIVLYFLGKRAEERQAETQSQMAAAAQTVTMLIIDKKKMHIKDAGLPPQVYEGTPWYARRAKIPVVKAKVGPKIMTLICDDAIFDSVPVKKEVKATVSGLYITAVRGAHGKIEAAPQKKKGLRARLAGRAENYRQQLNAENAKNSKKKK